MLPVSFDGILRAVSADVLDALSLGRWAVFGLLFLGLLGLDLFVHRGKRGSSRRVAAIWSGSWIAAGVAFAGYVWLRMGGQAAHEYLAAYLIEKSLSLDNMFLFLLVFGSLGIPRRRQRTVLTWGIFGALAFRFLFILAGAGALERWHWVEYVFGALLLAAAGHAYRHNPLDRGESRAARWLSRHLPYSPNPDTDHFLVREPRRTTIGRGERGAWKATPLLVAVLAIEAADVVFAIDSVPAAFSVTRNRFVVYSSNAFAILGLRSLYLVLVDLLGRLRYLHYGLAGVLAFAGVKLVTARWVEVPPLVSVGVIVVIVSPAVWASLRTSPRRSAGPA